ncbi:MAG: DUF4232 domain-containing protein [Labedaea sp.]
MRRGFRLTGCALLGVVGTIAAGCGTPAPDTGAGQVGTPTTSPVPTTGPVSSGAASPASSSAASPPTLPTPTPTPTPGGTARCRASVLRGSVQMNDAAAGNRYATLTVLNTGLLDCTLNGYGVLQLVDAQGNPTPTYAVPTANPGPALITVRPGETAVKKLHWSVVPASDEPVDKPCQPPSAGVDVVPPDEFEAFHVGYDFGQVCNKGRLEHSAYANP